ncbi:MAG: hypothetical protein JNL58_28910 [Planctomyces sp.]|nr:hypothetical protein [Planctomyces sp.]
MGTWGVAIFSDDLAADLRDDFRELIGDGLTSTEATDRLLEEHKSSLEDPDEMPVFWIALAAAQWKLGRLEDRTRQMALQLIDNGADLARWDNPKDRAKREVVLAKTREELLSVQPPAKRIPRTIRESNDWKHGELIGFRLLSGKWTVLRVIGHHTDKGGQFAVCELLDWVDDQLPPPEKIDGLPIRRDKSLNGISQFIFQQPKKKNDQARVVRMNCLSTPQQTKGHYAAFVWPHIDRQLESIFELR